MIADLRGLSILAYLDRAKTASDPSVSSRAVPASPDASRSAAISPDAASTDIGAPLAAGTAREPLSLDDLDPRRTTIERPTSKPRKNR